MQQDPQDESIVSGIYDNYQDTQKEILEIELKKTKNKLFTLAAIFFISDLIQLIAANAVNPATMIVIAVIPLLFVGLAFLSGKEPLLAMIICAVIVAAIWIYMAVLSGGLTAISGLIMKGVVVFLIIAGFQSAIEAQKIKKELKR
jgi:uncharacterized membrane protein